METVLISVDGELASQLALFDVTPAPVQGEFMLDFGVPEGMSCFRCGATSELISLGHGTIESPYVAICRLPGVCGTRLALANARTGLDA